jgi:hypothetical protein
VTVFSAILAIALLASGPGRPLHYWGARPAAIIAERPGEAGLAAFVTEVHVAPLDRDVFVRFSFDRAVSEAIHLPDGTPVSGRLRAVLYWDLDEDTRTGLDAGRNDPRTGAERRLEIGVVALGEDAQEKRRAQALVMATLYGLTADFAQEVLWRTDDERPGGALSWYRDSVEVRLPAALFGRNPAGRVVLTQLGGASVGHVGSER